MLLPACDRSLDGVHEARVHLHELLARLPLGSLRRPLSSKAAPLELFLVYRGRLRAAVAFSRRSSSRFNSGPDKVGAIFAFLPYSVDPRKRPLPTITALQNMLGMTLRAVNSLVYKARL